MTWNLDNKNQIRQHIVKRNYRIKAKAALFMPAESCLCVKEALKQRSINTATDMLIVDRDRATLYQAYENLLRLGWVDNKIFMYCGNVEDSQLSFFENSSGLSSKRLLDFVYIDSCGELSNKMLAFIQRLSHLYINKNATLSFTFMDFWRSNPSMRENGLDLVINGYNNRQHLFNKGEYIPITTINKLCKEPDVIWSSKIQNQLAILGHLYQALPLHYYQQCIASYKNSAISIPMIALRFEHYQLFDNETFYNVPCDLGY